MNLVILIALCTPHRFTELKQIFTAERRECGVCFSITFSKNAVQMIQSCFTEFVNHSCAARMQCKPVVNVFFVCLEWSSKTFHVL